MSTDANDGGTGTPPRHRADDDLEALALASNPDDDAAMAAKLASIRRSMETASPLSMEGADDAAVVHDQLHLPHMGVGDLGMSALTDGGLGLADDEDIDVNEPLELQYGSDDDDEDSVDDDGGLRDTVELSRRTMNLMDNFRDYVSEMGSPNETNKEGGDVEKGQLPVHGDKKIMQLPSKGNGDWFARGGGLRDFGRDVVGEEDDLVAEEYGTPRNVVRYKYAWLRDRRVKKGLGMILLAAAIIGIAVGVSKAKKESSLPDWNAELDEMLGEEKASMDQQGHHTENGSIMSPSEPLQKPPQSNVPGADTQAGAAQTILSDVLSHTETELHPETPSENYLEVAQKYAPKWFSRGGPSTPAYRGQTYEEALVFCAGRDMRVPCPYEAYCPDGVGMAPYGGVKDEPLGTWAPILDGANAWVQVSATVTDAAWAAGGSGGGGGGEARAGNVCTFYGSLHANPPDWGVDGGNEGQTRHVLCCRSEGTAASEEASSTALESNPAFESNEDLLALGYAKSEKYSPVWFGRSSGWEGQTYSQAQAFCAALGPGHGLCPYEAYCPNGELTPPYGGGVSLAYLPDSPAGISWAPLRDADNNWVQIGADSEGTCLTYEDLYAAPPEWGASSCDQGQNCDGWGLAGHIMCCAPAPQLPIVSDGADQSRPSADALFEEMFENRPVDESVIAEEYAQAEHLHPVWFDRPSGWKGTTYDEAVDFCASQSNAGREVSLCPYEAYCPTGPRKLPYGGIVESDVEAWAPVADAYNDWVQVSAGKDMCLTYVNKYLMPPDADEFTEEGTGWVMCCASAANGAVGSHPEVPPAVATDGDEDLLALGYAKSEEYSPVWYDRSSGWDGETYSQAKAYCAALGRGHRLCPYEAYCPNGGRTTPYGGGITHEYLPASTENMSWAPIRDAENDWVQIGVDGDGVCLTYMNMYLQEPDWGEGLPAGDNEAMQKVIEGTTGHLMCCGDGETKDDNSAESSFEAIPSPLPDKDDTPSPPSNEVENPAAYEYVSEKYRPVWYSRSDGWNGRTYGDALTFCASQKRGGEKMMLCNFEAYCPLGTRNKPFGGFHEDGGGTGIDGSVGKQGVGWSPISNDPGWWVSIGADSPCTFYDENTDPKPEWWGPDGPHMASTRHVMCCDEHEVISTFNIKDEISSEQRPSAPQSAPSQIQSEAFQAIDNQFHPIWYDRSSGWKGQTYGDALGFCESLEGSTMLCPYEVYCPMGPSGDMHPGASGGGWAAIADGSNHWVEVGGENECIRYTELYPDAPAWGITGEGSEELTAIVLCCSRPTPSPTARPTPSPTARPTPSPTPPPTPRPSNKPTTPPTPKPTEKPVSKGFTPKWYDRDSGWTGQTYQEANDFCNSKSGDTPTILCPFNEYCPSGENGAPFGGVKLEQNSWAPIVNKHNEWVQVGDEDGGRCVPYTSMYPDSPAWGITGEGNEGLTRHVLCCTERLPPQEAKPAQPQPAPTPSQPSPQNAELDLIYSRIDSDLYQPAGYGRYENWHGQNYAAAFEFCSTEHAKMPCPLEALCPNGIGGSQMGIGDMDPVWFPVKDGRGWVELQKDGYCATHSELTDPYVDVTRYLVCCESPGEGSAHADIPFTVVGGASEPAGPVSSPTPPSSASAFVSDDNPASAVYQAAEEKYHPVGYNRSTGWSGQTYGDALEFCASKNSKIPCPYIAVCPKGPEGPPVGGVQEGTNGVWVPIMDTPNGWASIGHKDTCMRYNDMKPHPPMWGQTGKDNEEITRHVMCCNDSEDAIPVSDEVREVGELSKTEELIIDTMHPVWFGRRDGYHGTTHEEAELFCRTVASMHLCPIEAYCPNGPRDSKVLFLQQDAFEGEQWAPISNYNNEDTGMGNDWIMVGTQNGDPKSTCSQYEFLNNGRSAPWSADGSRTELKEHALCCMQQEGMKHEQDISRGMNPIWLDDTHGWSGGSYSDAEEFCQGVGGKRLCPYAAYCPHGPGLNPMGGHAVDFNYQGEQWAPVFGTDNDWVLVGRKYGNSATTCYTHKQLEGGSPAWGVTGDRPEIKRNIQCCSF